MNEPDFVVKGLDTEKTNLSRPLSWRSFSRFVCAVADEVHSRSTALVTLGGARARNLATWDDDALGLDFLQVHLYYKAV